MAGSKCHNSPNNVVSYVVRILIFSFLLSQVIAMLLQRNVVRKDYVCWLWYLNCWYFNL